MVRMLQLRFVDGMVIRRKTGVVSPVSENIPRYLWKHCSGRNCWGRDIGGRGK